MSRDPRLPNLLVAGVMRSGTTSAYRYLDAHPDVYMSPVKEPMFLAFDGAPPSYTGPGDDRVNRRVCTSLDEYRALFAGAGSARWRGEASATYVYLPAALDGLRRHELEPFVLVFLRDPADRAQSAFDYLKRQGREPLATLAEGLDAEPERRARGWSPMWHYLNAGLVADSLQRWRDAVGAANVMPIVYEDLERDPRATFRAVFERLDVDPDAPIDYVVHNQSGTAKSVVLERLTRTRGRLRRRVKRALPASARRAFERLRESNIVSGGGIDAATRGRIVEAAAADVRRLEQLVGRDLAAWQR